MTATRLRARRGFTLVEAIVAIVLLSVGVLALVSSSSLILQDMTSASERTRAAAQANSALEALRGYNSCAAVRTAVLARSPRMSEVSVGATPTGGMSAVGVRYAVSYTAARRTRTDTFYTEIPCTMP